MAINTKTNTDFSWQEEVRKLQYQCWETAEEHGWHEELDDRTFFEKLCLVHSEVTEALEEYRDGRGFTEIYFRESDGKPEGIPVELADILIRVLDLAESYNMDIGEALSIKHAFNATRPYRHGGKKA